MPLTNIFARDRHVIFSVNLTVHELRNVPFLSGHYYVKYRTRSKSSSQVVSSKSPLQDHTVTFNWTTNFEVNITKDSDEVLNPCLLHLVVKKEASYGERPERVGTLNVNLCEFCSDRPVTRKLLLQETRTNTTVKISVEMIRTGGSSSYQIPSQSRVPTIDLLGANKSLWLRPSTSQQPSSHTASNGLQSSTQPTTGNKSRKSTGSTASSIVMPMSTKSSLNDLRMTSQADYERLNKNQTLKGSRSWANMTASSGSSAHFDMSHQLQRTQSYSTSSSSSHNDECDRVSLHGSFLGSIPSGVNHHSNTTQKAAIILPRPPIPYQRGQSEALSPHDVVDEIFNRARARANDPSHSGKSNVKSISHSQPAVRS